MDKNKNLINIYQRKVRFYFMDKTSIDITYTNRTFEDVVYTFAESEIYIINGYAIIRQNVILIEDLGIIEEDLFN